MIHPQYWSLRSIWLTFKHKRGVAEDYLSFIPYLKGAVVMDVGAADGDTAAWFLRQGAAKVICIEKNPLQAAKIIGKRHLSNVRVIPEAFRLEHLQIPHDCLKVDIEGYEQLLLEYHEPLGPAIVEVHNWYLYEKFNERGFRAVVGPEPMLGMSIMVNYP